MGAGVLILIIGWTVCALAAGCKQGESAHGRSWFDITHDTGRAARRGNR